MNAPLHRPWITAIALIFEGEACLLWPFCTRGGRRPQDAYPAIGGSGYVHVLLCELVHGPRPTSRHEAEHICGVKLRMNKKHIAWALHLDNCARRTAHGTQTTGERHGMAMLSEADVTEIRAHSRHRGTGVLLAIRFGVSTATISHVRNHKSWRHL